MGGIMNRHRMFATVTALISYPMYVAACSSAGDARPDGESVAETHQAVATASGGGCATDPRVMLGLVSLEVCAGADLFFGEAFGGNGRTCATCHPVAHNFTIDAAYIATLPDTDPLFVAELTPALAGLEIPTLMRQYGLILENLDGADSPTSKFVMRSVPHTFALATSVTAQATPTDGTTRPPNERTGWSGDGAPNAGELRDFQTGAVMQHYTKSLARTSGTDFVLPTSAELDSIVAYLRSVGRTSELTLSSVSLSDPRADAGRLTFLTPAKRCNGCHNNAGANVAAGFNRNFDTGVERARLADLNTAGIPFDGGFGGQGLAAFNHDANGDGIADSYGNGTFSTPPLIEAADTGPFFHTNAFATIEDAIGFYTTTAFAQSPAGGGNPIALTPIEVANLGRFLRVLNAAMNCQLALTRINAVTAIVQDQKNHNADLQKTLAQLALAEINDALADLAAVDALNASAQSELLAAQASLEDAATHASHVHRLSSARDAQTHIGAANASLGSGLNFTIGQGGLMF
jgi:cytochrome c peroxidase